MSLERRIKALFASLSSGCPSCGSEDLAFTEYEVEWSDPQEDSEPEFCPRCGKQLTVDINWGDIEESS